MVGKPKGGEDTENNNSDDNIKNYVQTTAHTKYKRLLGVNSDRQGYKYTIPN